jgi:signal recognition particle subunit SRP54
LHDLILESVDNRLGSVVFKLRNCGHLSDADIDEVLSDIRTALLEADVNVGVVRSVLARIREKAVGNEPVPPPPPLDSLFHV